MLKLQQQEVSPRQQAGVQGCGGAGGQADQQTRVQHQVSNFSLLYLLYHDCSGTRRSVALPTSLSQEPATRTSAELSTLRSVRLQEVVMELK